MSIYCKDCDCVCDYVATVSDIVCAECGLVSDGIIADIVVFGNIKASTYKHINYWREHMSMLFMQDNSIPEDLYLLIEDEASKHKLYGKVSKFTKLHLREVFRNIKIPEDLAEKYTTQPRAQNRFKSVPLAKLSTKYGDRWRSILNRLLDGQLKIEPLPPRVLGIMTGWFAALIPAYENVKTNKKHLLNYYFLIVKLMQLYDYKFGTKYVPYYSEWLPLYQSEKKIVASMETFKKIIQWNAWLPRDDVYDNQDPKHPYNNFLRMKTYTITTESGKERKYKVHYITY
jgi:hypothetical protein